MPFGNKFICLSPHSVLKHLEEPILYDVKNDELYELSPDAFQFFLRCSQVEYPPVREEDKEFIQYCLSENLIILSDHPNKREFSVNPSPVPSLRYLELQITDRCNLRCRHCYIGEGHHQDLSMDQIHRGLKEFEEIQGLRLLLSGGEPLLHSHFWEINDVLRSYGFRSVLLSNGTQITREKARRLQVHEVQLSLDGMEEGHESLRGKGTFEQVLNAIDHLQEANIQVSVATMIHKKNLKEFDQLASLLQSKEVKEWNVDVPCLEGRLKENPEFWITPEQAAPFLRYGYGGGWHGSKNNSTCGAHLCVILPNGKVAKCGLFSQETVGSIEEGLRTCWQRIPRIPLEKLKCNCSEIEACRGGCRYRAKIHWGLFQPDFFQCYSREVLKGGGRDEYQESD
jgi:radical SAM protein with 4Fe4S-binding SPASM domain